MANWRLETCQRKAKRGGYENASLFLYFVLCRAILYYLLYGWSLSLGTRKENSHFLALSNPTSTNFANGWKNFLEVQETAAFHPPFQAVLEQGEKTVTEEQRCHDSYKVFLAMANMQVAFRSLYQMWIKLITKLGISRNSHVA